MAGRRVLDVASGSGLVAIAAARAGAAEVLANDIDPYATAAIKANAVANDVGGVTCLPHDLLDGDGEGADVILAGDGLYEEGLAVRVLKFLTRQAARGALVLAGDPGRGHVPDGLMDRVAAYDRPHLGPADDHRERRPAVFRARRPESPLPELPRT
ncbi:50S ribosomal protein L11 methyltransferase [Actinoplanes sp. NPDC051475]|uniref:class I SAM-dependent methyltransferase n=1 Tax=Actinoplanes sp. NPDC051475 TaxID=3157225 RepID=UPI003450EADC